MKYINKVFNGTIITLLSTFTIGIFGYLTKLFIARSFSVADFGLVLAIISFFNILKIFYNFGLETSVVIYISEYNTKNDKESIINLIYI